MNFIFISPNFPHTYWNFCDRLKKNGVNVLGIGDAPYDGLEDGLKGALTPRELRPGIQGCRILLIQVRQDRLDRVPE